MKRRDGGPNEMLLSRIDADLLSAEELARIEERSDALIDLIGHIEQDRPDSCAYDDPRFVAWIANESGAAEAVLEEADIRATARRVLVALTGERYGVQCMGHAAPERRLEAPGPASELVMDLSSAGMLPLLDLGVAAGASAGRALWDAECESCVPLPGELPPGRYLALRVSGRSMMPLLCPGDVVLVRLGADVSTDTIVVARGPEDGYVVKRIGRVTRRHLELESLNPEFPSIQVPRDLNGVLGTVVLRWCDHGV